MTKKVVQFKPAGAANAARAASAPGRRPGSRLGDADAWVAAAQAEESARPADAPRPEQAAEPAAAAGTPQDTSELAESLGRLSREMSTLARAPLERHLGAAARLASCRTPAEALAAQSRLASDMMAGALTDFARLAEASARAGRALAATMERGPRD